METQREQHIQNHRAGKWQVQDVNPGNLTLESVSINSASNVFYISIM